MLESSTPVYVGIHRPPPRLSLTCDLFLPFRETRSNPGPDCANGWTRPVVVEATGEAGDVLLMHPLLVHSVSDARRITFRRLSEGGIHIDIYICIL